MARDDQQVKSLLIQFIVDNYMVEEDEVPHDRSLVDEGIIDSFGLVEIASFIEREFAVAVLEADMTRENFGSVNKLVAFIQRRSEP